MSGLPGPCAWQGPLVSKNSSSSSSVHFFPLQALCGNCWDRQLNGKPEPENSNWISYCMPPGMRVRKKTCMFVIFGCQYYCNVTPYIGSLCKKPLSHISLTCSLSLDFSFFPPACGMRPLLEFAVCVCVCLPLVWLPQECKSKVLPVL